MAITYDEIGNPLSDGTWTYAWEHGRELSAMTDGTTTWTYTYDANGLRTQRTNGTTTYHYVYNGSSLTQMTVGSDTLYFTDDTVTYNGTVYYYVKNIQGDIIAILDSAGVAVVEYSYDAWGNILSTTGELANTLGQINPLRYRGYVYDSETGLYYLQSRYYDPELSRFINADAFASTGQGILGNNMFAYCGNNPVNRFDTSGLFWDELWNGVKEIIDTAVQYIVFNAAPVVMIVVLVLHYNRNSLNEAPETIEEAIKEGYIQMGEEDDKFHQNNQQINSSGQSRNKKYISLDGHHEVVFYSTGELNDTDEDEGTYNVGSSNGAWYEKWIIHGIFDVAPYMIYGNSPGDSTTIIDRIAMGLQ